MRWIDIEKNYKSFFWFICSIQFKALILCRNLDEMKVEN